MATRSRTASGLAALGTIVIALALSAGPARATPLIIDRAITGIDSFGRISIDPTGLSSLVLADFTSIDLTLSLPVGEALSIGSNGKLSILVSYTDHIVDFASLTACGSFLNVRGPAPVAEPGGGCGVGSAGQSFVVDTLWDVFAGSSFTGIAFDFPVGAIPTQPPHDFGEFPSIFVFPFDGTEIVAMPEPSALSLFAAGLIGLWLHRRSRRGRRGELA